MANNSRMLILSRNYQYKKTGLFLSFYIGGESSSLYEPKLIEKRGFIMVDPNYEVV